MEVKSTNTDLVPTTIEPKMNNRFIVEFPKDIGIEKWVVSKIFRPEYDFKKSKWGDIHIEFLDPICPSTSQKLFDLIPKDDILKRFINFFKCKPIFTFEVTSLDPIGVVVEKWVIEVSKIKTINFGYGEYGSNEVQRLSMVIKPYSCKLLY